MVVFCRKITFKYCHITLESLEIVIEIPLKAVVKSAIVPDILVVNVCSTLAFQEYSMKADRTKYGTCL